MLLIDPRALQGKPADVKIDAFSSPGAWFDPRALQGKPADVKIDAFNTPGFVLTPMALQGKPADVKIDAFTSPGHVLSQEPSKASPPKSKSMLLAPPWGSFLKVETTMRSAKCRGKTKIKNGGRPVLF